MLIIEEINQAHDRARFDCCVPELNSFLAKNARQQSARNISRTYVLVNAESPRTIMGFYTLVYTELFPPKQSDLANYPQKISGLKLARLAVDKQFQGKGFGSYLLIKVFENALAAQAIAPIMGVVVDAKNDDVKAFYESFGFINIEGESSLHLWLPIDTCEKALKS